MKLTIIITLIDIRLHKNLTVYSIYHVSYASHLILSGLRIE